LAVAARDWTKILDADVGGSIMLAVPTKFAKGKLEASPLFSKTQTSFPEDVIVKQGAPNMDHSIFTGQKIWCPLCTDQLPFLRIPNAARLLEVDRRTIYRHIEDGSIHVFRVGGNGTYRICSGCLLAQHPESEETMVQAKRTKA